MDGGPSHVPVSAQIEAPPELQRLALNFLATFFLVATFLTTVTHVHKSSSIYGLSVTNKTLSGPAFRAPTVIGPFYPRASPGRGVGLVCAGSGWTARIVIRPVPDYWYGWRPLVRGRQVLYQPRCSLLR